MDNGKFKKGSIGERGEAIRRIKKSRRKVSWIKGSLRKGVGERREAISRIKKRRRKESWRHRGIRNRGSIARKRFLKNSH